LQSLVRAYRVYTSKSSKNFPSSAKKPSNSLHHFDLSACYTVKNSEILAIVIFNFYILLAVLEARAACCPKCCGVKYIRKALMSLFPEGYTTI